MTSSKYAKFSESELLALNPWTALKDFGMPRSEVVEPAEAPRTLTVEEIEAMQKQAYDEAFQQGHREGFEQGKQEGFEEGKKQGMEVGFKQGYQENLHLLQKKAADWSLLMDALSEPFHKLDEAVEEELVKLTIAIASQVVRREIEQKPDGIAALVRESIQLLPMTSRNITIILHPDDAELIRSVLKPDEDFPEWRLQENSLISRGGCKVETESSRMDATLESRIAAVAANLLSGERRQEDLE